MVKLICLLAQLLGIAAATSNGCKAHQARSASLLQAHQSKMWPTTGKLDAHPELLEKAKQKKSGHSKRISAPSGWDDAPDCYATASVDSTGGNKANALGWSSESDFYPQSFGLISNVSMIQELATGVEYCAGLCNIYSSNLSAGELSGTSMPCTGFQYMPVSHSCKFFNGDLAQMIWQDSAIDWVYISTCTTYDDSLTTTESADDTDR